MKYRLCVKRTVTAVIQNMRRHQRAADLPEWPERKSPRRSRRNRPLARQAQKSTEQSKAASGDEHASSRSLNIADSRL